MNSMGYPILSLVCFLPLIGAVVIIFLGKNEAVSKWMALITSGLTFLVSIPLVTNFDRATSNMQFVEQKGWIPSWHVNYIVGVDGISVLLVLAHHAFVRHLRHILLEGDNREGQGVYDRATPAGDGDGRRLHCARPLPVLYLLGGDAHPDVPPHHHMGRAQEDVRRS